MNTSGTVSSYSSVLAATQPAEPKAVAALPLQTAENIRTVETDRAIPADSVKGTQVDISV